MNGRITKNSGRKAGYILAGMASVVFCLPFLMGSPAKQGAGEKGLADSSVKTAAVLTCYETIDDGLYRSIIRRSQEAISGGADYLILDVQTYGGLVKSADDISKYLILELKDKIHTVAYVSTEAISAGAMISVSCKDVIMRRNTTIGCSAPIIMGDTEMGQAEREKTESFVRATFSRAAQANDYPEALLKAMVSQNLEVWQVKNLKTGKAEYFEKEYLPTEPNAFDLANKKRVVKEGELLTLTDQKALEYGIARAVVEDIDGAIEFIEKRDGVAISDTLLRLETTWSEELVRWLTSPAVVSILVLGVFLGIYAEFHAPGLGLPSLLAVVCLVILVGSRYLTGLANWIEIAVLCIGFILLMVEIFVIPGFGIIGFAGILCILAGLFGMLIKNAPGEIPWPKDQNAWQVFTDGLSGFAMGFLLLIVCAIILAKYMDRLPFLRSFVLKTSGFGETLTISRTCEPEHRGSFVEVGQTGEAVSTLRPAGKAKFGSSIVDVVTDGGFIEKGKPVCVLEVHGNRVVVSEIKENRNT